MCHFTRLFAVFAFCVATAAQAQQCVAPPPGVLAWYRGERNADDAAGFHNGAPLAQELYVEGQVGEAFRLDGADDGFGTDTSAAEQRAVRDDFTYELWARPTGTLGGCPEAASSNCSGNDLPWAIFPFHGDAGAPFEELGLSAGMGIAVGTNGICVGTHSAFDVNCLARLDTPITDWTHIVAVVQDKQPRIYVDGVLARTGITSPKSFVFASWSLFGQGSTLGQYAGDLDEVTIYDRALDEAQIVALFAAGSAGKCPADCTPLGDDAWQNATVSDSSALRAANFAEDAFGGTASSPEAGTVLFADGLPDGTVNHIEWETETPVTLAGFVLSATHDPVALANRALRRVRLQARNVGESFVTVYESAVVVPYQPLGNVLRRCVNLRPVAAQQFRIELTQDGATTFSGVRVEEIDGVGLPDRVFRDGFED